MSGSSSLRWLRVIGVVLTLVGAVLCPSGRTDTVFAETSSSSILLANLTGNQDTVIIDHRAIWCFGGSNYRLTYIPVPTPCLVVTDLNGEGNTAKRLAVVTLTQAQVLRLDNTLRFYREYHVKAGLSVTDTLRISAFRNGQNIGNETLKHSGGNYSYLEDADPEDIQTLLHDPEFAPYYPIAMPLLSLNKIVDLAKTAKQKHQATIPYPEVPRNESSLYRLLCIMESERAKARSKKPVEPAH